MMLLGMLATALGCFYAVKFGGAETQRLVKALHVRFDEMEKRQQDLEIQHARLDEQVKYLRQRHPTLRFKAAGQAEEDDTQS